MDEQNITPAEEETQSQYEELSKTDAMSGVFTAPSETYETIANTSKKNYWIIPVLISIVVGLIATFLFMRDAELVNKTMEKQRKKLYEQMEENVKAGKMTPEQSQASIEQAEKFMNPRSPLFMAIGYGGSVIGPFLWLFIWSLVYLVALKIMKAQFDFSNVLNVVGLAMLITALGKLLAIVISVIKGDLTSISPGLFLSEAALGPKVYSLISKLDIFDIWHFFVVAIGLSKISKLDFKKTALVVFGIWIIFYVVIISLVF